MIVRDLGDRRRVGNIKTDSVREGYDKWRQRKLRKELKWGWRKVGWVGG
ncbi:hypothetical protein, partial [Bacillus velezensis]